MPQVAVDNNDTKTWSSGELGQVLSRHAAIGLSEPQPAPPLEPEQEITPYITLDEELSSGNLTDRGVQALLSGQIQNYGANTSLREQADETGKGDFEEDEKKKRKKSQTIEMFRNGMASFSIYGIDMTENEAYENLELANKRLSKEQKANFEKAVVDVSEEELKTYSKNDDACLIVDGRPVEDISIIDGQIVETDVYYQMMIENSELEEQQQRVQQFSVQLESGDVTWEQVPDDVAALMAKEHEIQENGPQELEVQQPTVLEQLNNLGAEMQQIQTVKPVVSYASPLTP